jgi:serine O-acetyltransferase
MIKNKSDLEYYLAEDAKANDIVTLSSYEQFLTFFDPNLLWTFIKCLRKYEYYLNTNQSNLLIRIKRKYFLYHYKKLGYQLGFSIPPNVFGPGLRIPHYGTIVVHPFVKVGSNCVIQAGVNIGVNNGGVPTIGDNVYIGPGAKLFGSIEIANDTAIGANAVVTKSFTESNITIAGIPAKIIKHQKANER